MFGGDWHHRVVLVNGASRGMDAGHSSSDMLHCVGDVASAQFLRSGKRLLGPSVPAAPRRTGAKAEEPSKEKKGGCP
jgi:lipid-binding SYLF domain-containing protein